MQRDNAKSGSENQRKGTTQRVMREAERVPVVVLFLYSANTAKLDTQSSGYLLTHQNVTDTLRTVNNGPPNRLKQISGPG